MSLVNAKKRAPEIARKWLRKLGQGFHPDTPADEYVNVRTGRPSLSRGECREYEADMAVLFQLPDPYALILSLQEVAQ